MIASPDADPTAVLLSPVAKSRAVCPTAVESETPATPEPSALKPTDTVRREEDSTSEARDPTAVFSATVQSASALYPTATSLSDEVSAVPALVPNKVLRPPEDNELPAVDPMVRLSTPLLARLTTNPDAAVNVNVADP